MSELINVATKGLVFYKRFFRCLLFEFYILIFKEGNSLLKLSFFFFKGINFFLKRKLSSLVGDSYF